MQRVLSASVKVDGIVISEIGPGLLTLLGAKTGDSASDVERLIRKIVHLRIFDDADGKMNLSVLDTAGSHLIVSQFTLWGSTAKGNRPSYIDAARPEIARPLYEKALAVSQEFGVKTLGGKFQASMKVTLENDGPVTLLVES